MENRWIVRSKHENVSFFMIKKDVYKTIAVLVSLLFVMLVGLMVGSDIIPFHEVIQYTFHIAPIENEFALGELRMPRVLSGMIVGASLAVAGLIVQGIIRNPLASPDVIGVTGGASVCAVLFLTYFSDALGVQWTPIFAVIGAIMTFFIIYLFSLHPSITANRIVLIGIGLATLANAVVMYILVTSASFSSEQAYLWLTGSLYGVNWLQTISILVSFVVLFFIIMWLKRKFELYSYGDSVAEQLGLNLRRFRIIFLFFSALLCGLSVSIAGGIGFIGLLTPHISRRIVHHHTSLLFITTAGIGAILVVLADWIARIAFQPLDIPVGVFTSGIGAPFFIYLLIKNRNSF
ncbi:FecCD family ABC transporter permease [Metabacillus sediminilitoris]|uniref:Iron ABC transporter permease n=1 Tax=Metabacillus sediminilitoris TaxID=2567941 RepID=A0A4S4BJV1_9BACI|nr:iron chelate uptake ABC transporter family permease subunit [Metabacillus sediminilitoris]QGQ45865.1 iron chelate uptake ABC transporter family permease subunit [Metabacillus sediminilitoris]THF74969.1 iron ABC transporter permease [Metabacillus sediminilitoris]